MKIWEDPWLPFLPTKKIIYPKPQNTIINLVADLRQGEHWNDRLLKELFSQAEILTIKEIQIRDNSC